MKKQNTVNDASFPPGQDRGKMKFWRGGRNRCKNRIQRKIMMYRKSTIRNKRKMKFWRKADYDVKIGQGVTAFLRGD